MKAEIIVNSGTFVTEVATLLNYQEEHLWNIWRARVKDSTDYF